MAGKLNDLYLRYTIQNAPGCAKSNLENFGKIQEVLRSVGIGMYKDIEQNELTLYVSETFDKKKKKECRS